MTTSPVERTIRAIWHIEAPRILGALVRMVRDVALAEDLAQEALVCALERWPLQGIPHNPGAWLLTTAKRRGIDALRRAKRIDALHQHMPCDDHAADDTEQRLIDALDEPIQDDVLRLMYVARHPALSPPARVALTLRLLGGLTTEEIAHAYLVPEPTIAQRIVRAKRTLATCSTSFEMPAADALHERLGAVMQSIYLISNEGYAATRGDHWLRPTLCDEASRLGRILAALAPAVPEVHGLCALMALQASRLPARTAPDGAPILLQDQDRSRWDHTLIRRGLDSLQQALRLSSTPGYYTLQAALAACHARAHTAAMTDWRQIVHLYDALYIVAPSPIITLNRAVAVSHADGPHAALPIVETLCAAGELVGYHLLHAVRADLLARMDRREEARQALLLAASLTLNTREQTLLRQRAQSLQPLS